MKKIIWRMIGYAILLLVIVNAGAFYYFYQYTSPPPQIPMPTPGSVQSSKLPPPQIPLPTDPSDEKIIAIARQKFAEGNIAFKPPKEMEVSITETLEARITYQPQTESLVLGLQGSGQTVVKQLKVSCRMRLTLKSVENLFEITPLTPQEVRLLDPQEPYSSWKWDITPKKPGTHEIHLVAEAFTNLPGIGEKPLYIKTFDYTIKVKVTTESFLEWAGRSWQYLLGSSLSILIPLAGWLWNIYSKRKEKLENKQPEPPRIIMP